MAQNQDIENRFTYHTPTPEMVKRLANLRHSAKNLAYEIAELVPPSREQALALTKLEESIMHANAGIVRHPTGD